jgi:hypothetical protein
VNVRPIHAPTKIRCHCSRAVPSNLWKTRTTGELRRAFQLSVAQLKRDGYDSDSADYLHSCHRHHNRPVTGLWFASLHDGKRGTCQVSQAASCLGRYQPLLDIRNSARTFAALTCGSAGAFPSTRTHGKAGAFLPHRSAMPIFAMRVELAQQLRQLGDVRCDPPRLIFGDEAWKSALSSADTAADLDIYRQPQLADEAPPRFAGRRQRPDQIALALVEHRSVSPKAEGDCGKK